MTPDRSKLSPMMKHYMDVKDQYPDVIVMYRLGDFYEMFFDDAVTVSRELELTLTGRDCGLEDRAPMCGVPYHAVDTYVSRLINKGYKVAICEQLSDPKASKGMVDRDVVRVITAGTVVEDTILDERQNNYLAAFLYTDKGCSEGNVLMDGYREAVLEFALRAEGVHGFVAEILLGVGQADIITGDENIGIYPVPIDFDHVMEIDREVDHSQIVVSVFADAGDLKREIDFGVRARGDGVPVKKHSRN